MTAHITDIGTTPALFLVAILLMLVGLGMYLFFSMSETRTVMYITNAGLLALCAMFGWFLYGAYHSTVTIEGDMLRVNVPIYGRAIALASVDADKAEVVDMNQNSKYKLGIRTNGLGVPGYGLGWFRRSGGGRIYAVITDKSSVVYLPTTEDYAMLLSIEEPDALLEALGRAPVNGS